jgi:hypothetical protein
MNSIAKIGTIKAEPILLKKQIQLNLHSTVEGGGGVLFQKYQSPSYGTHFFLLPSGPTNPDSSLYNVISKI